MMRQLIETVFSIASQMEKFLSRAVDKLTPVIQKTIQDALASHIHTTIPLPTPAPATAPLPLLLPPAHQCSEPMSGVLPSPVPISSRKWTVSDCSINESPTKRGHRESFNFFFSLILFITGFLKYNGIHGKKNHEILGFLEDLENLDAPSYAHSLVLSSSQPLWRPTTTTLMNINLDFPV